MNIRSAFGNLRMWVGLPAAVLLLCGCVAGVAADIVSIGTSGKSVTDHVLDVVTGEDCNLFQAVVRAGRNVCEPREVAVTPRDVDALEAPDNLPEASSADPFHAAGPSDGPIGPVVPGLGGDPGGPSLSGLY